MDILSRRKFGQSTSKCLTVSLKKLLGATICIKISLELQEGQLTNKLCMLFFEALKRCQPVLEPVFIPLFPRFINTLVQKATVSEVPHSILDKMICYSTVYSLFEISILCV